jgi:hypothetical protein
MDRILGDNAGEERSKLPDKKAPKTKKENGIWLSFLRRFSFQCSKGKKIKIAGNQIHTSRIDANLAPNGCSCEANKTNMGQTKNNPIQTKKKRKGRAIEINILPTNGST